MNVFTLVGLALLGTSAAVLIKDQHKDIALLLSAAFSTVLLLAAFEPLKEIVASVIYAADTYGLNDEYIKIIIKIIGVSYLVRFAADICNDSGETAMANKVELLGKLMVTVLYIPVIGEILAAVAELMGI